MADSEKRLVEDQMTIKIMGDIGSVEDDEVLANVRAEIGDRSVVWKIRNRNGTLQQACDYYHGEELILEGEWFRFEFVDINDSNDMIQFAHIHGGGEMPLTEWVENTAKVYLEDELTEIWDDVKKQYDAGEF